MSEAPRCCRFCGCEDVHSDGFPAIDGGREIQFECGTLWREDGESWIQDRACKGQVGALYRRLSAALQALRATPRFRLERDKYGAFMKGRSDGSWVDRIEVERAIVILEGVDCPES
jgi:hypothetical protein